MIDRRNVKLKGGQYGCLAAAVFVKFMKDLDAISSKVSKGQNLNTHLEKYGRSMASLYHALSLIKLSMNYYTVCDIYYDTLDKKTYDNDLYAKFYNRFHICIQQYLVNQIDIEQLKIMRQDVINLMNRVVSLIDQLRIYEYVMNRVEYRFKDKKEYPFDKEYYDTYLTNDVIHYIFSEKDNVVVNSKIAQIVGQLPMRLSKNRFFSYVREAFSLYHGAQKGSIDDFEYSIRSTAMLSVSKKQADHTAIDEHYFDEYKKIMDILANADYKTMDTAAYYKLDKELKIGIEKINNFSDNMVLLAQLVNDLYTAVLMEPYSIGSTTQTILAKEIISIINNQCFVSQTDGSSNNDIFYYRKSFEEIADKFVAFEGIQENILSIVEKNEYVLDDAWDIYKDKLEAFGVKELFESLKIVTKLQSGSDFVVLENDASYDEIPDNSYADTVCEHLIDDMQQAFKVLGQPVKRAVMATVFSQLPVLFNNTDEIQNYINMSLIQCSDEAEQMAVVEILKSMMEG